MSVVEDLENENLGLLKTVDDLKAEIERLRGALKEIAHYDCTGNTVGAYFDCKNIARQALEGDAD